LFALCQHHAADLRVGEREVLQANTIGRLRSTSARLSRREDSPDALANRRLATAAGWRRRRREDGRDRRHGCGSLFELGVWNEAAVILAGRSRRWRRTAG